MINSKWHNISIKTESFKQLQEIQKEIPIRASIPQTIEWLILVGAKQIIKNKSELSNDNRKERKNI
jgi:hypothetical protein